jgi:hypothetical protein
MTSIIDLTAERNKREAPDADCVRTDDFGRPLYLFALEYKFDDRRWEAEIWAHSWDDAEARVAAMRQSLEVSGKTFAVIPGGTGV